MDIDPKSDRAKLSRQKQSVNNEKTNLIDSEVTSWESECVKVEETMLNDVDESNCPPKDDGHSHSLQATSFVHSDLCATDGNGGSIPIQHLEYEKQAQSDRKDLTKGLLLALFGAGIMYGLTGVFVRLAAENGVGSAETLFVRSVVQSIVFGGIMALKKIPIKPPSGRIAGCLLITVMYSLATISSFEAFNVIPPGNAIATRGASRTVFAIWFSFLFLQERVFVKDFIAILTCLAGIVLIIVSSITSNHKDYLIPSGMSNNAALVNTYGYSLIIFAGITRAVGMVNVRKMKGEIPSFTIVLYHSSLTIVISSILLIVRPLQWPPTIAGIMYTLAVCFTSSLATWSSNRALQWIHPGLVAFAQNADLVVSIVLEHTILSIAPSIYEILGAILIFGAVSVLAYMKWEDSKNIEQLE